MTEPILSEEQARRLWERAAQIQAEAEAARREEEENGAPEGVAGLLPPGEVDEGAGYSLTHVRQAGVEAGIQPEFLELALAEETLLELEGGGGEGGFDRLAKRLMADDRRALEIRRHFDFPARSVWLSIESTLIEDPNRFDLVAVRGGEPETGGVAIFESGMGLQNDGSLRYWSQAADAKRCLLRITPEEDGQGCEVLIRIPLRRSRRVRAGLGAGFVGGVGFAGGVGGSFAAGALAVGIGLAGLPAALIVAGGGLGGVAVTGGLIRKGWNALYRSTLGSLQESWEKLFRHVERELERGAEMRQLPE